LCFCLCLSTVSHPCPLTLPWAAAQAYGKLDALMDPEQNSDARAIPLQEVVLKAFRTLANPDKRDRCMETYVEARDKVGLRA
jgi:hypothetical protein